MNDGEALENLLVDLVYDWAADYPWDSEDAISSEMAMTNSIFAEAYIDDVQIDEGEGGEWQFTLSGTLNGHPRKDDVPFCGDTIRFSAEGSITYDEETEEWNISETTVTEAEVEDWTGEEEKFSGALSGLGAARWPSGAALSGLRDDYSSFLIPEKTISSADDLFLEVSKLSSRQWYRGHGDAAWALCPGIARQKNPSLALETKLRLTFENQSTFLDPASHPLGTAKCNFLMQHHGLPTRLLDWTTSPLTALYFAVCNIDRDGSDGCLWVMDPSPLNRVHSETFPYECDGEKDAIFLEESARVLAIHAPYTNLRMKMQQSEFTVHAHYRPLEDELGAELYLKEKITIRHQLKPEIRNRLLSLGVTRASLFPDLDNIARTVKDDILEESGQP